MRGVLRRLRAPRRRLRRETDHLLQRPHVDQLAATAASISSLTSAFRRSSVPLGQPQRSLDGAAHRASSQLIERGAAGDDLANGRIEHTTAEALSCGDCVIARRFACFHVGVLANPELRWRQLVPFHSNETPSHTRTYASYLPRPNLPLSTRRERRSTEGKWAPPCRETSPLWRMRSSPVPSPVATLVAY